MKNLERVQGDERDVIILSIGVGKARSGKVDHRGFGPLNGEGGERRLNVAITRARQSMTLVSSFGHVEMDPERSRAGSELLRLYLQYAASGGDILGDRGMSNVPLNPFEADVHDALSAAGIPVLPQWGASRYRINLVARHPQRPGQFVLAIECDGASYHSAPTARDRDRLRQQHLETLGWRFHRIWSTDWFLLREQEVQRALVAYQSAVRAADHEDRQPMQTGGGSPSAKPVEPATSTFVPHASGRGPRPFIQRRPAIDQYSRRELIELIQWIKSDGRLRTDDQILDEVVRELGFQRKGPRIVDRVRAAIDDERDGRTSRR